VSTLRALIRTIRPKQWVKNLFVAAPLVFAKRLTDPVDAGRGALAVAAFCAISGAIYVLNDVVDAEKDRAHPTKRHRPIAAGVLSRDTALAAAALLAVSGLAAALWLAPRFGAVAAGYLVLNLAYSFKLKQIAFVDVAVIAAGFLLRVLGGAWAIPVPPSFWLLACSGLLAAYLGFGKRAHELALAQRGGDEHVGKTRAVLAQYDARVLRALLLGLAAVTSAAYVMYTQAAHTVAFFGTRHLIWTAPFCLFGIFRFYWLTGHPHGDSPTDAMLHDVPFMANVLLWGLAVVGIIYLAS
jgi:4-hydroxybenzoate polyprenyltransferase